MQENITLKIDPSPNAALRFEAWLEEKKAELEAAGINITHVTGTTFHGTYDPSKVDIATLDF